MTTEVRSATDTDRPGIDRVVAEAFGDEGRAIVDLLGVLDATGATSADLVAVEGGEVVGHVRLSRSWVDARERLVDVLVLSPLSVALARQRDGIGTALLAAAVQTAERLGAPAVFLEGDWTYYGARGFAAATPLGFTRPSPRVPEPAFQVRLLAADEPWMRGPLVYCEAFWATDSVGLRDPFLAEVEARAGLDPS